ncbi:unnamed protein product [Parnassius mnemosyne]|uniref:Uncharacterized protein n=1 Tax=Parnassius mnemosyne TaxID=213953 RepID=A0AAV1L082_9NEOP
MRAYTSSTENVGAALVSQLGFIEKERQNQAGALESFLKKGELNKASSPIPETDAIAEIPLKPREENTSDSNIICDPGASISGSSTIAREGAITGETAIAGEGAIAGEAAIMSTQSRGPID